MEVSGQFNAPAALRLEKQPPITFAREYGWESRAGVDVTGKRRISFRYRKSNHDSSVDQPVA
jgi:hypothetical protein